MRYPGGRMLLWALASVALEVDVLALERGYSSVQPGDLRIVSYNVRRFQGEQGESTVDAIGDALAKLSPTIVALNEVDITHSRGALESIARRLGNFSVAFFGHLQGSYGNALLSRHPIVATREAHLRGGTVFTIPAGSPRFMGGVAEKEHHHRIVRGMLECDIAVPENGIQPRRTFTVAVTHLDHMSEEQRQIQLAHVVETLQAGQHPTVLVGDMNALTRSDYTDQQWSVLEHKHAANGWSLPEPARCLESLTSAGFVDAFSVSRGGGSLSAQVGEEEGSYFTAHVDNPSYRIDYCFVGSATGLKVSGARVHSDVKHSDHFPVSFDLAPGSTEAYL